MQVCFRLPGPVFTKASRLARSGGNQKSLYAGSFGHVTLAFSPSGFSLIVPSCDARLRVVGSTTIKSVSRGEAGGGAAGWLRSLLRSSLLRSATAEVWAKFFLALVGLG